MHGSWRILSTKKNSNVRLELPAIRLSIFVYQEIQLVWAGSFLIMKEHFFTSMNLSFVNHK